MTIRLVIALCLMFVTATAATADDNSGTAPDETRRSVQLFHRLRAVRMARTQRLTEEDQGSADHYPTDYMDADDVEVEQAGDAVALFEQAAVPAESAMSSDLQLHESSGDAGPCDAAACGCGLSACASSCSLSGECSHGCVADDAVSCDCRRPCTAAGGCGRHHGRSSHLTKGCGCYPVRCPSGCCRDSACRACPGHGCGRMACPRPQGCCR